MRHYALGFATIFALGACAEQGTLTAPAKGLTPGGRSKVVSVGGGALAEGVCTRSTGQPIEVIFPFSGAPGSATLGVTDNGVLGLNGTITLNGGVVVTHPILGGNAPVDLSVPVTLLSENVLVCKLEGKPGSGLAFQVTQ